MTNSAPFLKLASQPTNADGCPKGFVQDTTPPPRDAVAAAPQPLCDAVPPFAERLRCTGPADCTKTAATMASASVPDRRRPNDRDIVRRTDTDNATLYYSCVHECTGRVAGALVRRTGCTALRSRLSPPPRRPRCLSLPTRTGAARYCRATTAGGTCVGRSHYDAAAGSGRGAPTARSCTP